MSHSPETLAENPHEELPEEETPAMSMKKESAKKSVVPEVKSEHDLRIVDLTTMVKEALADKKRKLETKGTRALIKEVRDETKDMKGDMSEVAQEHRRHQEELARLIDSYLTMRKRQKDAVYRDFESLKKTIDVSKESEGASPEADAAPQTFIEKIMAFPGKLFGKIENVIDKIIPTKSAGKKKKTV